MPVSSLATKLKLKPSTRAAVLNAPKGYLELLSPGGASLDAALEGQYDWIQIFVRNQAELAAVIPGVKAALKPVSLLWISFPKSSSKIQTDLTRDSGWGSVTDMKWTNLVSVDETWSAFSVRPYKPGEAKQNFR